ncbi:uncharacterized protein si:ch211-89o9.4 [Triplophysa dalaica]|uniref:uncharacterized protein si:ch211-89o9.4 n=1 Tax=Triplophysa dalaica TaxID=1582913 RepID=UPI0024DF399F|nr:uncharacterized protein si:ch211-89o9.4 [Triplophysa dalaica]
MKTTQNTDQRKRNSSYAHPPDVDINPLPPSAFTCVPPPIGTPQAILLRLAQIQAQLVLNLINNLTTGNQSSGNPFVLLYLLQAAQRTPYLSMYQPQSVVPLSHLLHRQNVNSTTHIVNPPSPNGTRVSSVTEIRALTAEGPFQAKEVFQETARNTTQRMQSIKPLDKNVSSRSMNAIKSPTNVMTPLDRQVLNTLDMGEKERHPVQHLPSESLRKALASLDLSLEDLELLSHCPDDHLTQEMLPLIIQDMQKRKEAKAVKQTSPKTYNMPRVIEYGHVSKTSDQAESQRKSSYTYDMHNGRGNLKIKHSQLQKEQSASPFSYSLHSPYGPLCDSHTHGALPERFIAHDFINRNLSPQSRTRKRDSSERRSKIFLRRLQHGHAEVTRNRPGSVFNSSGLRHSLISPGHIETRHFMSSDVMTKGHDELSFTTVTSERNTESVIIQKPVDMENVKTSTKTQGVIRLSRIPLDFSESELIQMASPFGKPVEVLMATEIDMVTRLEWKKALVFLPSEISAQEMVKVYSAIPPHMRRQSLELVSQSLYLTSSVSVFHAFVGPSTSNGLLTPVDHLLVVCNVPREPCAATGVLRLLKPFGQVFRTLVFNGNKVDVDQCLRNNNCIQMVLEMESAAVALSVYEWSQKIPCIYHNHNLSFIRGSHIELNIPEVKST